MGESRGCQETDPKVLGWEVGGGEDHTGSLGIELGGISWAGEGGVGRRAGGGGVVRERGGSSLMAEKRPS